MRATVRPSTGAPRLLPRPEIIASRPVHCAGDRTLAALFVGARMHLHYTGNYSQVTCSGGTNLWLMARDRVSLLIYLFRYGKGGDGGAERGGRKPPQTLLRLS